MNAPLKRRIVRNAVWLAALVAVVGGVVGGALVRLGSRKAEVVELAALVDAARSDLVSGESLAEREHRITELEEDLATWTELIANESLRMRVVAGPRIDPESLPGGAARIEGLEILPYVHNLYEHLAVCDLAIVQGGLTTSMELTANRVPFLYFPLAHHFEQNFHVRHRLENYRAGRCMDFATSTSESIARAITRDLDRRVSYRAVETDGARRAAQIIAEVL